MPVIRIDTDQEIASITINFVTGGVSTTTGNRTTVERSAGTDGPKTPHTQSDLDRVRNAHPMTPEPPREPTGGSDWHEQADAEFEAAVNAGPLPPMVIDDDEDDDAGPPIDMSQASVEIPKAKVIEAPSSAADIAEREIKIDPSMANASY